MLLDPGPEQRTIDGSVDGEWSNESFRSQRSEKGSGLPTTAGGFFDHPRAECGATVAARHVGFGPRFIDENYFAGID